jgi:hypothetical protein
MWMWIVLIVLAVAIAYAGVSKGVNVKQGGCSACPAKSASGLE